MNEDKSTRYHRAKRRASAASLIWTVVLLAGMVGTGLNVWLRTVIVSRATMGSGVLVVPIYVLTSMALLEIGAFPIALYSGFLLERRYGLSTERLGRWLLDQVKSLLLMAGLAVAAAAILYACIRRAPESWWLPAGVVFTFLTVGLAKLAPVIILPVFFSVRPLDRESLRVRLLVLAERAGARVVNVYEWGLGDKTRKANAALTGTGKTRRILVSDTMLQDYSEDEIEVVLAHELAHHVHGDIWKGLIFEGAATFAALYAGAMLLGTAVNPLALTGPGDVAGLPVVLLAIGAVLLLIRPAGHAMSRAFERRADWFALELTRNPAAFVSAMKRLSAQNLAEDHPSRVVQWLFYSHPPVRDRIAAAEAFGR